VRGSAATVGVCALAACVLAACGGGEAGGDDDGAGDGGADIDTMAGDDASATGDGALGLDAANDAAGAATLSDHRDRLFRGNAALGTGADVCARWASLDVSRKAVFLTLTHRLFVSRMADGTPMLVEITAARLILGGGANGTTCGGAENNRLFLTISPRLHQALADTWNGTRTISDGASSTWLHTEDLAGPHDPFTASTETDTGLSCLGPIELGGSRPPTAQAHFFLDAADAVPVQRGTGIDLPADPYMFEIDHDFDCLHQSNPLCPNRDFAADYITNYGDYAPAWAPAGC
jgi:hypothetical protein